METETAKRSGRPTTSIRPTRATRRWSVAGHAPRAREAQAHPHHLALHLTHQGPDHPRQNRDWNGSREGNAIIRALDPDNF